MNKNNNNKLKKYKQKYVTGGRVDMSKGGRVKLEHGGKPNMSDFRDMYGPGADANAAYQAAMVMLVVIE